MENLMKNQSRAIMILIVLLIASVFINIFTIHKMNGMKDSTTMIKDSIRYTVDMYGRLIAQQRTISDLMLENADQKGLIDTLKKYKNGNTQTITAFNTTTRGVFTVVSRPQRTIQSVQTISRNEASGNILSEGQIERTNDDGKRTNDDGKKFSTVHGTHDNKDSTCYESKWISVCLTKVGDSTQVSYETRDSYKVTQEWKKQKGWFKPKILETSITPENPGTVVIDMASYYKTEPKKYTGVKVVGVFVIGLLVGSALN